MSLFSRKSSDVRAPRRASPFFGTVAILRGGSQNRARTRSRICYTKGQFSTMVVYSSSTMHVCMGRWWQGQSILDSHHVRQQDARTGGVCTWSTTTHLRRVCSRVSACEHPGKDYARCHTPRTDFQTSKFNFKNSKVEVTAVPETVALELSSREFSENIPFSLAISLLWSFENRSRGGVVTYVTSCGKSVQTGRGILRHLLRYPRTPSHPFRLKSSSFTERRPPTDSGRLARPLLLTVSVARCLSPSIDSGRERMVLSLSSRVSNPWRLPTEEGRRESRFPDNKCFIFTRKRGWGRGKGWEGAAR